MSYCRFCCERLGKDSEKYVGMCIDNAACVSRSAKLRAKTVGKLRREHMRILRWQAQNSRGNVANDALADFKAKEGGE